MNKAQEIKADIIKLEEELISIERLERENPVTDPTFNEITKLRQARIRNIKALIKTKFEELKQLETHIFVKSLRVKGK